MGLRDSTLTAARWTTVAAVARAILQVAQVSFLARLLEPGDFGLLAMAGTVTGLAALFSDLGLSSALIHYPAPPKFVLRALWLLNFVAGLLLWGLITGFSPAISTLYEAPRLAPVLSALGLVFPINALGQQSRALAEKNLEFRTLAKIEIASIANGVVISSTLGWAGAGPFSLVGGILATASLNTLLLLLRGAPYPAADEAAPPFGKFLNYGVHRLAGQAWNALRQQADTVIASLFGSAHAVALYATPRDHTLRVTNTIINPVVTRIAFPVMAGLQQNPSALAAVYLKILRFTASANFPIFALVACFPSELILVFLGPKWLEASPYLRLFAIWALLRSTGHPSGSLLNAVGMVQRANYWNFLLMLATIPPMWYGASRYGLLGLATSMLALQSIIFFLTWRYLVLPAASISFRSYLGELLPPLGGVAVASAVAITASLDFTGLARLVIGGTAFALSYLLASLVWNRKWLAIIRELVAPVPVQHD